MRYVLCVLLCMCYMSTYSQSSRVDKLTPKWVGKMPSPSNISFSYQITTATDRSVEKAEDKCLHNLLGITGMQAGAVVSYDKKIKDNTSKKFVNGNFSEDVEINSEANTIVKSKDKQIHIKDIDKCVKRNKDGSYTVTTLYAYSNEGFNPIFDDVKPTTYYGFRGAWRSMIVPGWGQFYKGSKLKGGLILGGVAVTAVGAVYCNTMADDYYSKMAHTYDVNAIRTYKTKGDQFASIRNICIGAAGAIYLYNIIDAIAAPGARRIKIKRKGFGNIGYVDFSFAPTIFNEGALGMGANVKF